MSHPPVRILLSIALLALILAPLGCSHGDAEKGEGAALSAVHPQDHGQPPLPQELRSPAGRVVAPGTVDENG